VLDFAWGVWPKYWAFLRRRRRRSLIFILFISHKTCYEMMNEWKSKQNNKQRKVTAISEDDEIVWIDAPPYKEIARITKFKRRKWTQNNERFWKEVQIF
jgi:hypothetical protein